MAMKGGCGFAFLGCIYPLFLFRFYAALLSLAFVRFYDFAALSGYGIIFYPTFS